MGPLPGRPARRPSGGGARSSPASPAKVVWGGVFRRHFHVQVTPTCITGRKGEIMKKPETHEGPNKKENSEIPDFAEDRRKERSIRRTIALRNLSSFSESRNEGVHQMICGVCAIYK